jgi:hypothetical protein
MLPKNSSNTKSLLLWAKILINYVFSDHKISGETIYLENLAL